MTKIWISAALLIAGLGIVGCGGTPNCDAYSKSVDDCCAKPNADASRCTNLKASSDAAKALADNMGTDCAEPDPTFMCPLK